MKSKMRASCLVLLFLFSVFASDRFQEKDTMLVDPKAPPAISVPVPVPSPPPSPIIVPVSPPSPPSSSPVQAPVTRQPSPSVPSVKETPTVDAPVSVISPVVALSIAFQGPCDFYYSKQIPCGFNPRTSVSWFSDSLIESPDVNVEVLLMGTYRTRLVLNTSANKRISGMFQLDDSLSGQEFNFQITQGDLIKESRSFYVNRTLSSNARKNLILFWA